MRTNSRYRKGRALRLVGVTGLVTALSALAFALGATPSMAADGTSHRVALLPGAAPNPPQVVNGVTPGVLPTTSYVTGKSSETFSGFSFSDVGLRQITTDNLAKYDTAVLNQVHSSSLTPGEKAALAQFVAGGGKLLIHDSDETVGNDYSWLLGGQYTTNVGAGCNNCGSADPSGTSTVTTSSGIISSNPDDASYVDLAKLRQFTDQGDANLLVSTDPRWQTLVQGTKGNGDSGAEVAYARIGSGLIIYNGFDTDFIKANAADPFRCDTIQTGYHCAPPPAPQPTVDWLAHIWYSELAQGSAGAGIPPATPVVGIGTPISSGSAGLPSPPAGHACVARKRLRLSLSRFAHMRHRKIVQVDVYVNGRHRFRERSHFRNQTLRRLPSHGRYTVTVIATTKRGYHLIAKRRYRAC